MYSINTVFSELISLRRMWLHDSAQIPFAVPPYTTLSPMALLPIIVCMWDEDQGIFLTLCIYIFHTHSIQSYASQTRPGWSALHTNWLCFQTYRLPAADLLDTAQLIVHQSVSSFENLQSFNARKCGKHLLKSEPD